MGDDDLRDELRFRIDMRTQRHVDAGMTTEDAEALARTQFGNLEVTMKAMRRALMRSPRMIFIAVTLTFLAAAGLWLVRASASPDALGLPPLPRAPLEQTVRKRPPPPPGPTWEEFVAKVNTFGDGNRAKRPRR